MSNNWRKKHFELIAGAIARTKRGTLDNTTLIYLVIELSNDLEKENPHFDRTKFFRACGLESEAE